MPEHETISSPCEPDGSGELKKKKMEKDKKKKKKNNNNKTILITLLS